MEGPDVDGEPAALAAPVVGGDRHLAAKFIRRMRLALADTLGLGRVPGIELSAAPALFLALDLFGAAQGEGEDFLQHRISLRFAANAADQPPRACCAGI